MIHFRTRIRFSDHSNQKPCGYFLLICRYISKSLSENTYDPPFSPASKLRKAKKKKTHDGDSNSNKNPTLPLQSDLPFDFFYSYSETNPSIKPIGFRESPKFSPFGPGRLDRKWTGTSAPAEAEVKIHEVLEERKRVLGDALSEEEVAELVEEYRHDNCSRQINLARNGVYVNVVERVREAFKFDEVIRLDCTHVGSSDCKQIGVKLRDLVPCVPILFKDEQIILWRGKKDHEENMNSRTVDVRDVHVDDVTEDEDGCFARMSKLYCGEGREIMKRTRT